MADFSFLRYSNVWEDPLLLLEGLSPLQGARVASICSAGDNALALALGGAGEVVAFDLNPVQLFCLQLRIAALRRLERHDALVFLGYRTGKRDKLWTQLQTELSGDLRRWYEALPGVGERGVVNLGKFEAYFGLFRRVVWPLMAKKRVRDRFLLARDPAERQRYYAEELDTFRWRLPFRLFFSKWVMGPLGRDPEFFAHVKDPTSLTLLERTKHALTVLDPSKNPFVEYIITGRFEVNLPHYLLEEHWDSLRANLGCVRIEQADLASLAARYPRYFDAFNLSDIFEYMDEACFKEQLAHIAAMARPGARAAYWNMMVPRCASIVLPQHFARREAQSRELFAKDRAFFYRDFVLEDLR